MLKEQSLKKSELRYLSNCYSRMQTSLIHQPTASAALCVVELNAAGLKAG